MTESDILFKASGLIEQEILKQWTEQGHHLSNGWEDSLTSTAVATNEIEGYAKGYGLIVNAGVMPSRIPYGGTPTGAATSLYIQGLVKYFISRGKDPKTALSLAFATAKVQKKDGMSTIGSFKYSSTGKRQNFIADTIEAIGDTVDNLVFDGLNSMVMSETHELEEQTF